MSETQPEVWMRGPVEGVPPLLQPVAHALLQAVEEVERIMQHFPSEKLWDRPAGLASPGFHLQHLSGIIDRLGTYALGRPLSATQLAYLKEEGEQRPVTVQALTERFGQTVQKMLLQLRNTDERTLTEFRGVGRKQLPSTVLGLLFHAAEHTMRHVGQLLVTVRITTKPL